MAYFEKKNAGGSSNVEQVISYALAFVVVWFGTNEIFAPGDWAAFVPSFLGTDSLALSLVVVHGLLLTASGLLLAFNFYRRIGAIVLALMLAEIIVSLLVESGLTDVAARDIGLLGIAVALALPSPSTPPVAAAGANSPR